MALDVLTLVFLCSGPETRHDNRTYEEEPQTETAALEVIFFLRE